MAAGEGEPVFSKDESQQVSQSQEISPKDTLATLNDLTRLYLPTYAHEYVTIATENKEPCI